MTSYKEQYTANFSTRQMFDLVADIEKYPEFLPWCTSAHITKKTKDYILAELSIRFSPFSYKYTSKVRFTSPKTEHGNCAINVELVEGPFDELTTVWKFKKASGGSLVTFEIDFQANSSMLNKMLGLMFTKAMHKIATAFQERARAIY